MRIRVVAKPAPIIDLARAKAHLRVEHNRDDGYIQGLVAGVVGWLDGPDGWLGRALGPQTLELKTGDWRDLLRLPYAPIIEIVALTYVSPAGVSTPVDEDLYTADQLGLTLAHGKSWPAIRSPGDVITCRYRAGYLDTFAEPHVEDAPEAIKAAILLMVGHLYEHRSAVTLAKPEVLPLGVDALLNPYRIYSL